MDEFRVGSVIPSMPGAEHAPVDAAGRRKGKAPRGEAAEQEEDVVVLSGEGEADGEPGADYYQPHDESEEPPAG